jgi:hypothetical protein
MFGAVNKTISSVVETLQSYLPSTYIVNGFHSIYSSIQQLFTWGSAQTTPISVAPLSTVQVISTPAKKEHSSLGISLETTPISAAPLSTVQVIDTPAKKENSSPTLVIKEMLDELDHITTIPTTWGKIVENYSNFTRGSMGAHDYMYDELDPLTQRTFIVRGLWAREGKQRLIAVALKTISQYLPELPTYYSTRATNIFGGNRLYSSDPTLSKQYSKIMNTLVDTVQQLMNKVTAEAATAEELNGLIAFIVQQNKLFTEFSKEFASEIRELEEGQDYGYSNRDYGKKGASLENILNYNTTKVSSLEDILNDLGLLSSGRLGRTILSSGFLRGIFRLSQEQEPESTKQRRIAIAKEVINEYLPTYLSYHSAKAADTPYHNTPDAAELASAELSENQVINILVKAVQQLIHNVETGNADFEDLIEFIGLQDPLRIEFEIKLKAAEEEEAEAMAVAALQLLATPSNRDGLPNTQQN